jgi:hypothetical protein
MAPLATNERKGSFATDSFSAMSHLGHESEFTLCTQADVRRGPVVSGSYRPELLRCQALSEKFRNQRFGVEFIDENGGGGGVRLRNRQGPKKLK